MRVTSYTEFRKNLAAMIDQVNDDHVPLLVTRDGGKRPAVLMALDDFASYEETAYLLSSPKNAERLMEAIREADAGGGTERTLIE